MKKLDEICTSSKKWTPGQFGVKELTEKRRVLSVEVFRLVEMSRISFFLYKFCKCFEAQIFNRFLPDDSIRKTKSRNRYVKDSESELPWKGRWITLNSQPFAGINYVHPALFLKKQKKSNVAKSLNEEVWPEVLLALKNKYNTLYGVIRMAVPSFTEESLKLSFEFGFHQKRLIENSNRQKLIH